MDTWGRQQRRAEGVNATAAGNPEWQERGGQCGLPGSIGSASAAPDNERIRKMLGWGLIPANGRYDDRA
ncbi:hypothetical protein GJ700_01475 [Duganella sp. FT92W]|uniref:Uncharacterized protein n=1 Tax=Pseudoduganella rivuli TaxID=2666085 RepID=A0A7X2IIF2_9BURK|nr:hypothetical protein [Pseudoduganella rivuli]MRV70391.1 hypothetical protein [Pseudoduganella rivuli]